MMKRTIIQIAVALAVGLLLFAVGWWTGGEHIRRKMVSPDNLISADTTTAWTPIQDVPVLVDSAAVAGVIDIVAPVVHQDTTTGRKMPDLPALPAIVMNVDSAVHTLTDSAHVLLPITSKVYETENYRAVVTGYNPTLSEITIYQPTTTIRNNYRDTKRWRLTIGAQIGYGITPSGFQPYAGVGVTFGWSF